MAKRMQVQILCLALTWLVGVGVPKVSAQLQQLPAKEYIDLMERPARVALLKADQVVAKLGLQPGDVVADVGAGSGLFSVLMARAIGPTGTLYAVDIDEAMLRFIAKRAATEGLANVRTVLGEYDDPKLPVKTVDVAFFHDVLHMIEHRQAYLNAVAKYLKPDGRIAIIETNPEHAYDWMWLKQSDVDTWMAALSFYPIGQFDLFVERYFVVYQRPYGNSVLLKCPAAGRPPATRAPGSC